MSFDAAPQPQARARQARAHRPHREAEESGDVLVGELFAVAQRENGAPRRGELLEALRETAPQLSGLERLKRRAPARTRALGLARDRRLGPLLGVRLEGARGAAHLLGGPVLVVERAGHGNRMQPGRETRLTSIGGKRLPGRQEDLLHDVLAVLVMADDPPHDAPDPGEMDRDELLEGLAIALARPFEEGALGGVVRGGRGRSHRRQDATTGHVRLPPAAMPLLPGAATPPSKGETAASPGSSPGVETSRPS